MWFVFVPFDFDYARVSHLVNEIDDDIGFLHTDRVEMFSNNLGEIIFALASVFLLSGHCGRAQANAWS